MPAVSPRLSAWLFALLATATVSYAQRPTFTVGGASPDFTSLPLAIATVPPGSVVVVRPGVHEGFTTGKPLRVVLDFGGLGGFVQAPPGSNHAITISGLPAGDEFVLLGRDAAITGGVVDGLRIADTVGTVVVERVYVAATGTANGIAIDNAASVHLRRSVFAGFVGMEAQNATLTVSECVVVGNGAVGAALDHVRFDATRTFFTGWRQPGLRMWNCVARLSSNGLAQVAVAGAPSIPVAAIEALQCQLQCDPSVLGLQPANGAPGLERIGGAHLVDEVPTLTASGAPPGQQVSAAMTSLTPRIGALLFGNLAPWPAPFEFSSVFLDVANGSIVVGLGICDSTGLAFGTQLPNAAAFLGQIWCLQGVVQRSDGLPLLSGPGLWIAL